MHEIVLISVISKRLFYRLNFPSLFKVDLKFKETLQSWAQKISEVVTTCDVTNSQWI